MFVDDGLSYAAHASGAGRFVTAEELGAIASLLKELRDVTQSRRTFTAASDFLARIAPEETQPLLVPADVLER